MRLSAFCRLAGRVALFRGFPFRWVLHLALSLTRSIIVHVATLYSRKDPPSECSRPCDNLSCLCFTALWFQQSQSVLMHQKSASEGYQPDLLHNVPDQGHHVLTSGPMSPGWTVVPIAKFDRSRPSSSPEDPNDEQRRGALPVSTRSRPDRGLRCLTWNTRGLVGSVFPRRKTGSPNSNISGSSLTTTSYVSRRFTERMSISRLFRCWLRD